MACLHNWSSSIIFFFLSRGGEEVVEEEEEEEEVERAGEIRSNSSLREDSLAASGGVGWGT